MNAFRSEFFGQPLDWKQLPNRRAYRINFDVANKGYRDESAWPETHSQMIDAMVRLEQALRPHVDELR